MRPPTYVEQRWCSGCTHFRAHPTLHQGECHHPMARDHWGHLQGMRRFMSPGVPEWPPTEPENWCGFWRPAS